MVRPCLFHMMMTSRNVGILYLYLHKVSCWKCRGFDSLEKQAKVFGFLAMPLLCGSCLNLWNAIWLHSYTTSYSLIDPMVNEDQLFLGEISSTHFRSGCSKFFLSIYSWGEHRFPWFWRGCRFYKFEDISIPSCISLPYTPYWKVMGFLNLVYILIVAPHIVFFYNYAN